MLLNLDMQMDNATTFTFRPRNEELKHWNLLRQVCLIRGITMSSLLNAMLLPLTSELAKQKPNANKTYTLDLGSVTME